MENISLPIEDLPPLSKASLKTSDAFESNDLIIVFTLSS